MPIIGRQGLNNRIENSHRLTRKREKIMGRFKSPSQAQASCQPMTRSIRSSALAATVLPPFHTAMHGLTHSACGPSTPLKWRR